MSQPGETVDKPRRLAAVLPALGPGLPLPNGRRLDLSQPRVMGILNITPDSFSDGGRHLTTRAALERAHQMIDEGADLIDLGAESTRPGGGIYGSGAETVDAIEEINRLQPVLAALRQATDLPISVDTRKASVARVAIDLGADIINDVSALADPDMADCIVSSQVALVLMHSRGELGSMQTAIHFDDVLGEVRTELAERVDFAEASGIDRQRIVLDPGIGFGKTVEQNLELIARLGELTQLGLPILLGASRKSFLSAIHETPPSQRLPGSLAAAARGADQGAAILRVHDVADTRQFLDTWLVLAPEIDR